MTNGSAYRPVPPRRPKGVRPRWKVASEVSHNGIDVMRLAARVMNGEIKASARDRLEAAKYIGDSLWGKVTETHVNINAEASIEALEGLPADTLATVLTALLSASTPASRFATKAVGQAVETGAALATVDSVALPAIASHKDPSGNEAAGGSSEVGGGGVSGGLPGSSPGRGPPDLAGDQNTSVGNLSTDEDSLSEQSR